MGPAYDAVNNSQYKFNGARPFAGGPDRFETIKDIQASKRPGPSSYQPKLLPFKLKDGSLKATASRFSRKEYRTDAPGPGSYRVQSDFGIYSTDSSLKKMPADVFNKVASQKVFSSSSSKKIGGHHTLNLMALSPDATTITADGVDD